MPRDIDPATEAVCQLACERLAGRLGFERAFPRGLDSLDFRDVSVQSVMTALRTAWLLGYAQGSNAEREN